jgi:hypothetical protein
MFYMASGLPEAPEPGMDLADVRCEAAGDDAVEALGGEVEIVAKFVTNASRLGSCRSCERAERAAGARRRGGTMPRWARRRSTTTTTVQFRSWPFHCHGACLATAPSGSLARLLWWPAASLHRSTISMRWLTPSLSTRYGDDEPQTAFLEVFNQEVRLPAAATALGVPVDVVGFDYRDECLGVVARCRRDGLRQDLAVVDLVFPRDALAAWVQAAYRRWLGLDPHPCDMPTGWRPSWLRDT